MKKLIIPLLATVLLLLTTCKKEYPTIYMSDEMKEYVMHPIGSWWVYQDSATGELDSVSLENQMLGIERGGASDMQYDSEYLYNVFFSSKHGTIREGTRLDYVKETLLISYSGLYGCYADKLLIGESTQYHNYLAHYDSLLIKGVYFRDVKYFKETIIGYMSPNIGLIRREFGGVRWDLIRYHIKK